MRVEIRYVRRKLLAPYVPEDIWKTIKVITILLYFLFNSFIKDKSKKEFTRGALIDTAENGGSASGKRRENAGD